MARIPLRRFFRHGFLPQLLAFEAVVRLGSVTRAAEELCLAQPTVSCMLRKLADTVGGPVIVIRERRVEPTDVGRELVALCHAMQGAMTQFEEKLPQALGYDRLAAPAPPALHPDSLPWPLISPAATRSRWRQRASQCPRAKRRLSGADGAS